MRKIPFVAAAFLLCACLIFNSSNQTIEITSPLQLGAGSDYEAGSYDLDGLNGTSGAVPDVEFIYAGGSMIFVSLLPINNASAIWYGPEEPGLAGCTSLLDDFAQTNIPQLSTGSYICWLTSRGRLVQLEIKGFRWAETEATIELGVTYLKAGE